MPHTKPTADSSARTTSAGRLARVVLRLRRGRPDASKGLRDGAPERRSSQGGSVNPHLDNWTETPRL